MVTMNVLDIPQGYKKTEVGVIPEDWELAQLSNLCERISVGLATSVTKYYRNKGVPIVRNMNIKDGYFDSEDMLYLDSGFAKKNISKAARAFDVITVHTGSNIGLTCVLPENFDYCQTFTTLITTTNKKRLNPFYLSFHMSSESGKKEILRLQVGGGKGNLNTGELKQYLLSHPKKLTEQTAIATALSDVDALICELEKLIAKKQAIKTATMQQLLTGKTRLPQFALRDDGTRKGYKQSELGAIPEDWDVKTYGEVFTFLSTSTNSRDDLSSDGDLGYIHYGDIHTKWNNRLDLDKQNLPKISRNLVSSALILDGDLIMADASEDYQGIGKSVEIFNIRNKKIVAGLHTFLLRDKNKILADGFRGYLHAISTVKAAFDRLATGLKVYGISKNNLTTIFLPVPSIEEQTAIAKILVDMDSEIQALEQRLVKTRQIKQGMMQELLTGKTRLLQGTVNT